MHPLLLVPHRALPYLRAKLDHWGRSPNEFDLKPASHNRQPGYLQKQRSTYQTIEILDHDGALRRVRNPEVQFEFGGCDFGRRYYITADLDRRAREAWKAGQDQLTRAASGAVKRLSAPP